VCLRAYALDRKNLIDEVFREDITLLPTQHEASVKKLKRDNALQLQQHEIDAARQHLAGSPSRGRRKYQQDTPRKRLGGKSPDEFVRGTKPSMIKVYVFGSD